MGCGMCVTCVTRGGTTNPIKTNITKNLSFATPLSNGHAINKHVDACNIWFKHVIYVWKSDEKWISYRKLSLQFKDNTRDSFTPTWDPVSGFLLKTRRCHHAIAGKKRSFAMVLPRSVMLVSIKRAGEKFDQLWRCCCKTYQNGKLHFQKIADTKTETYSNVTSIRWIAFTCFICMSQHCCTKSGSPGRSSQMCNASKIPKSREMCHQACILKTFKIYHNCQTNFFHASHTVAPSLWNIEFDQNAVTSHLGKSWIKIGSKS